jgi:hypothetical protein
MVRRCCSLILMNSKFCSRIKASRMIASAFLRFQPWKTNWCLALTCQMHLQKQLHQHSKLHKHNPLFNDWWLAKQRQYGHSPGTCHTNLQEPTGSPLITSQQTIDVNTILCQDGFFQQYMHHALLYCATIVGNENIILFLCQIGDFAIATNRSPCTPPSAINLTHIFLFPRNAKAYLPIIMVWTSFRQATMSPHCMSAIMYNGLLLCMLDGRICKKWLFPLFPLPTMNMLAFQHG